MQHKTADKLVSLQGHVFLFSAIFTAIVLVFEGDAAIIKGEQSTVRDGHPMRVTREVGQYRFRPAKGRLAYTTHSRFYFAQRTKSRSWQVC
jgi:hypothetical protein